MDQYDCQYRVGRILSRACGVRGYHTCAKCGIRLCNRHVVQGASEEFKILCPPCSYSVGGEADDSTYNDTDSDTDPWTSDDWHSSRSWHEHRSTDSNSSQNVAPEFTAEEEAAFDKTGEFDRDNDRDGAFDS